MKESEVQSSFEQDVLQPIECDFANFAKYIKTLEAKGVSFALVS